MHWEFVPYAAPLFAGAGGMVIIALESWRHRAVRGAIPLGLLALASAVYALGYAFELGSSTLDDVLFWIRIEYLGITTGPVLVLILALAYTGHTRVLTPLTCTLLLIIPAITLLLAWTDGGRDWLWRDIALEPVDDHLAMTFTRGGWYWVSAGYIWLMIIGGGGLLLEVLTRTVGLYRRQIVIILSGCMVPLGAYALYLLGLIPSHLDPTPYALCLTSLIAAWGMYHYHVLDIVPVAREEVLNSLEDAVLVIDAQDRVSDFNAVTEQITRLDLKQAIGRPAAQVFGQWAGAFERHRSVSPVRDQVTLDIDGERRFFDLRISPLHGCSGQNQGRLLVLHDVTHRVRAEEEREKLIQELEAFAHTVAHDLKNPLMTVAGYAEVLLEDYATMSDSQKKEYLSHIAAAAQSADRIVNALLLLAGVRIQEAVTLGPLDIGALVAQVQLRLQNIIIHYQAEITEPPQWPVAIGYAPWVEEIWVNYLSNALKYGGQPPRVELGYDLQPEGRVRFWVRDHGHGLTPEEQARLFRPFTRLGQANIEGQGLGLSIVQRIAERLAGSVGVESQPGEGSLFFFTLPAASSQEQSQG